ncbi:MAG: trigger factor [Planctomycetes bacterium]|nr:trigger factor [Planctomycetota bacterium]
MAEAAQTEKEQKKLEPKASIEEIGPCKLRVKIEVAAEKIKERIDEKYKELNDTVALPGFRKGHAPRSLLERKFGKDILENVKFESVSGSFDEVKEEKKLEPVGEPEIDVEKISVEEGKPLAFEVVMEVRPSFELKDYAGIPVKKPKIEVADAEVDEAVRGFQEARAELIPAEDGLARENDQVICDLDVVVEGKAVKRDENAAFFLTEKLAFFGAMLPDFSRAFHGRKAGEVLEHAVTLPEAFPDANHRNKPAHLRASVKGIKRKKLPAVDAEFCKEFDCDSVEELRDYLRKRLAQEKEHEVRDRMADEVVKEIVKRHDFAMPEGLVKSATDEALQRARIEMLMRGAKEEEIDKAIETMRNESREEMARTLRSHFILEQIAAKERIFVTEDQVEERVQQLATRQGVWPHELKAHLEKENLMAPLRRQMKQEQVREFLLSKAVIQE